MFLDRIGDLASGLKPNLSDSFENILGSPNILPAVPREKELINSNGITITKMVVPRNFVN